MEEINQEIQVIEKASQSSKTLKEIQMLNPIDVATAFTPQNNMKKRKLNLRTMKSAKCSVSNT